MNPASNSGSGNFAPPPPSLPPHSNRWKHANRPKSARGLLEFAKERKSAFFGRRMNEIQLALQGGTPHWKKANLATDPRHRRDWIVGNLR